MLALCFWPCGELRLFTKLPDQGAGIPSLKNLKMSLQTTATTQARVARGSKIHPRAPIPDFIK
jgi:hypothetical protein